MKEEPTLRRPAFGGDASPMDVLVGLSRWYGSDPEFALAGGGNTSAKVGSRLYVKASGVALGTISPEDFVAMDREALFALLERDLGADAKRREEAFKEAIHAARVEPGKSQRPSVECVLHNALPQKFVVHTHSTYANMVTCSASGEAMTRELFGDEALWISYVDPGYVLARTVRAAVKAYAGRTGRGAPSIVLMQNHGLIVAADVPDEILRLTDSVVEKVRSRLDKSGVGEPFGTVTKIDPSRARRLIEVIAPALRGLLAEGENLRVVTFDGGDVVMSLAGGADGETAAKGGPLTPDQIVYCKSFPMWFEAAAGDEPEGIVAALRKAIDAHKAAARFAPSVVLVKGLGLFAAGADFAAADTVRLVYADAIKVMGGARCFGGVRYLDRRQREFIEDWEVENYRRQVAASGAPKGRFAGKVAVVTGAAQGFGFEIAKDLFREGGHVALTDVNLDGVRSAAENLVAHPAPDMGRAMALPLDVTDEASVAEAFHEVVRRWGGFDLLVSNAGILKAGSVKTQPADEFGLVADVNYKGYFVCVQKAAPILSVQHLAKPDYLSDIIQVNSKSGLVGSNRNSAYAGSKFGGIGLTQSFAMELIEDGIKVNAICPGNFFDGPLWSDPKNGLFAQYLRSGKVPGARTVDDVRRAYEAKIPMGRGCTAADVMKALYYLVEQRYETGQALPVTGGQVMLG